MAEHYYDLLILLRDSGAGMDLKDYKGRDVNDCLLYFGGRHIKPIAEKG